MPDPLAEYHFNLNPYHYVENNPIRYIDPFGLDKEEREKRRQARKNTRRNYRDSRRNNGDSPAFAREIPEVEIVGKQGGGKRKKRQNDPYKPTIVDDGITIWNPDDPITGGPENVISRNNPKYDKIFELEDKRARSEYERREKKKKANQTSDKEIVENSTGTGPQTTSTGETVSHLEERVKQQGLDSLPIIRGACLPGYPKARFAYDKDGKGHGPFHEGDTIRWEYYEDGTKTGEYRLTK